MVYRSLHLLQHPLHYCALKAARASHQALSTVCSELRPGQAKMGSMKCGYCRASEVHIDQAITCSMQMSRRRTLLKQQGLRHTNCPVEQADPMPPARLLWPLCPWELT